MLDARSIQLRRKIISVLDASRKGHIKSAFSCLEIVRVLYDDILREGDKFILSKGHGCLAQYVMLADKGYISDDDLFQFCKEGALLGGHPSHKINGVEVSTGSLGHGLPIGVGFALAGHRTFVLLGDGECNEGSVWEAAMCASKHKLSNLTVIVDCNEQQSYGSTREVLPLKPFTAKWEAFGFFTRNVDGHNSDRLLDAFSRASFIPSKPQCIIAHTTKGKGIKFVEDDPRWHYKNDITDEQIKELYEGLEGYNEG
ncbi:hypothetical protein LCGC14_0349550 [marine sediment metagenome]|uniref:Transketolase N-terminal domain-containing protein n=1 Tax=marine sediment metagenome TaxID=412755 RepID=A0A0F9WJ14_9ZZZZ